MKRRKVGIVLVIVGLCIIGAAIYMRYSASYKQKNKISSYEKSIEDFQKMGKNIDSESDASPNVKSPSQEINGTVGLMIIPKIDLKVAIGEGIDMETLKYAVGHFTDTAMPGEKGNFCVAGHRSYTYNEYFNRLDEMKIGDEIIVKTVKGEYKYKVYETKVVEPTEVSVLEPTKDATLTLVTCTPVRVATHRLIIKGRLEGK